MNFFFLLKNYRRRDDNEAGRYLGCKRDDKIQLFRTLEDKVLLSQHKL